MGTHGQDAKGKARGKTEVKEETRYKTKEWKTAEKRYDRDLERLLALLE